MQTTSYPEPLDRLADILQEAYGLPPYIKLLNHLDWIINRPLVGGVHLGKGHKISDP